MRQVLTTLLATSTLLGCAFATEVKDDAKTYTRKTGEALVDTGKDIGAAGKEAGQGIGQAARDAGRTVRDGTKEAKEAVSN